MISSGATSGRRIPEASEKNHETQKRKEGPPIRGVSNASGCRESE